MDPWLNTGWPDAVRHDHVAFDAMSVGLVGSEEVAA
jgi:hypothetical protein